MKPADFARRYGWDIERLIYDIIHGHENTCPYCSVRYEVMGHGLDDMTLDIVDCEREPYYRTNAKWCCQTCNREKQTMTSEMWARRLIFWKEYKAHIEAIRMDQTHGLLLNAIGSVIRIVPVVGMMWLHGIL